METEFEQLKGALERVAEAMKDRGLPMTVKNLVLGHRGVLAGMKDIGMLALALGALFAYILG